MTARLRVVDGDTGQALPGAQAMLHERMRDLLFGTSHAWRALPLTDEDGLTVAHSLNTKLSNDVDIRRPGYADTRVRLGGPEGIVAVDTPISLEAADRDAPRAIGDHAYYVTAHGTIVVRMYKR